MIIGLCKVRFNTLLEKWSRETCPGEVSECHRTGMTSRSLAIRDLTCHIEGKDDRFDVRNVPGNH